MKPYNVSVLQSDQLEETIVLERIQPKRMYVLIGREIKLECMIVEDPPSHEKAARERRLDRKALAIPEPSYSSAVKFCFVMACALFLNSAGQFLGRRKITDEGRLVCPKHSSAQTHG